MLKKAQKKLITQKQAASELELSERQVRRLVKRLAVEGDRAVEHALRGRVSNRKLSEELRQKALAVLSLPEWKRFGPTLASYHLAKDHDVRIGREALRQMMTAAGLWRAKPQTIRDIHVWRPRRSCPGELMQWDTSEHDWLEGRGEKLYLISMIDDATSRLLARFVSSDSTEENMRLLWTYLKLHGQAGGVLHRQGEAVPHGAENAARQQGSATRRTAADAANADRKGAAVVADRLDCGAQPQAKGRVERGFGTAQDRLVKRHEARRREHTQRRQPLSRTGVSAADIEEVAGEVRIRAAQHTGPVSCVACGSN